MKAYKVFYQTGGKATQTTVLSDSEEKLEEALSKKDKDYKVENRWSRITSKREIPLSNVLVSELSITEFLELDKISNEDNGNVISVDAERYYSLLEDSEFLSCLRACGVDNWSGYGDAYEMMDAEEES